MKEQLKKILYAKCISESATNKAVEEVCNLIESNQKEFEGYLKNKLEGAIKLSKSAITKGHFLYREGRTDVLKEVLTKYKELNK